MRRHQARIEPIDRGVATAEQQKLLDQLGPRGDLHIYRTLARHPSALEKFLPWGHFLLLDHGQLAPRDREAAILRTGYLCRSAYEWSKHAAIGAAKGLSSDEIAAIKVGASAPNWSARDRALLAGCDELITTHDMSDVTWAALTQHFSQDQLVEIIYVVGQYVNVSMLLNTLGVQLEPGIEADPDLMAITPIGDE